MPGCVNFRLPAAKLDGRDSLVQVEVGNSVELCASQISTSKSSPWESSETTIRLVSTQPPAGVPVWNSCAWSLPSRSTLSLLLCETLLTRMRDAVCASAGVDQRSTPPSASASRASSAVSASGSGARRREAVMTYPRLAVAQKSGGGGG